mmetsp:Transcript_23260/g.68664  ORF Transcript_23260/g.68664 Transcript_23260/m.68664 type:complete len:209 (+) Transcript_23260:146-772(+)
MQWCNSDWRVLTSSCEISGSASPSAPAAAARPSSAESGARVATRKCPCSRRICLCTLLTRSSDAAPAANLLSARPRSRCGRPSVPAGAAAAGEASPPRARGELRLPVLSPDRPRAVLSSFGRRKVSSSSSSAAAGAGSSPLRISGKVSSHWSPLKSGICRADLMCRNSSTIDPNRATTPCSLDASSTLTYHERSFSRFIGLRSSGGLA